MIDILVSTWEDKWQLMDKLADKDEPWAEFSTEEVAAAFFPSTAAYDITWVENSA